MRVLVALTMLLCTLSTGAASASECSVQELPTASTAARLACLSSMARTGALAQLGEQEFDDLLTPLWQGLGLRGASEDADSVRILVREGMRRWPDKHYLRGMEYGALMLAGRVHEAEVLAHSEGTLSQSRMIPRLALGRSLQPGEAAYWRFDSKEPALREHAVDLSRGRHIVVYSAPACAFTVAAARDIEAHPELRALFLAQSHWVDTPDANYSIDFYASWSKEVKSLPINVLFSRSNWPARRIPAVPYFLLLNEGEVVGEMIGWYPDSIERLQDLLERSYAVPGR